MNRFLSSALALACVTSLLLLVLPGVARSSPGAGATVRNAFGPDAGLGANQCRGACGGGCPRSCRIEVRYECVGESRLRRVEAFTCGTHQGCREHDDCLDDCLLGEPGSKECQTRCDLSLIHI